MIAIRSLVLVVWCLFLFMQGCIPEPIPNPTPEPPDPRGCVASAVELRATRARAAEPTRSLTQLRIVGGEPVSIDDYPWAVAITTRSGFQYCGGAYMGDGWVRTAAHCEVQPGDLVVMGREDLRTEEGTAFGIDLVLTHGDYNVGGGGGNDIAMVRLIGDTVALDGIEATPEWVEPGKLGTVIGWGLLAEGGSASPTLQGVSVPVVSNEACDTVYGTITDGMICAGLAEGAKDACQGDSGGPLMVTDEAGTVWQAGITSFGAGCARPGAFGVYTRLSEYLPWEEACRVAWE